MSAQGERHNVEILPRKTKAGVHRLLSCLFGLKIHKIIREASTREECKSPGSSDLGVWGFFVMTNAGQTGMVLALHFTWDFPELRSPAPFSGMDFEFDRFEVRAVAFAAGPPL
jgi:hypothetical protein